MTNSEQARAYKAEVDEFQKTAKFSKMGNLISPMSIRKARAVEMLAGGATATFICETLGIARSTLWEWRQDPEFKQQVEEQVGLTVPSLKRKLIQVLKRALMSIENQLIDGDDDGKLAMKMIASAQVWKQLKELEDDDIDQNRAPQDRDLSNIAKYDSDSGATTQVVCDAAQDRTPARLEYKSGHPERKLNGVDQNRTSHDRDLSNVAEYDPDSGATTCTQVVCDAANDSTPARLEYKSGHPARKLNGVDQNRAPSNMVEHNPDSGHDLSEDSTSARLEYKSGHPDGRSNEIDQNRTSEDRDLSSAVERFPGARQSPNAFVAETEVDVHETANAGTIGGSRCNPH
jgi:Helix-turn-helix of insertion element transposase